MSLQSLKAAIPSNVHLWFAFHRGRREVLPHAVENLKAALGDRSRDELFAIAGAYSEFYQHRFHLHRMLTKNMRVGQSWWRVEGLDHIENALKHGRGAIVVSAHFGHVRLIPPSLRAHGYPARLLQAMGTDGELGVSAQGKLKVVHDNENIRAGLDIRPVLSALSNNQILILLGDGMRSSTFTDLPFLRDTYPFPTGFLKIAFVTGALVLPAFALEQGPGRPLVIRILPPLEMSPSSNLSSNLQLFVQALEYQIQTSPYLWHRWNICNLFENARAWSKCDDRWNYGFREWCALQPGPQLPSHAAAP